VGAGVWESGGLVGWILMGDDEVHPDREEDSH